MKSKVIKFLTDKNTFLENRVRDYLTESIIDKDLDISLDEYMVLDIGDIEYVEDFVPIDETPSVYQVYDVTVIGPDDVIDRLEDWDNIIKESLQ